LQEKQIRTSGAQTGTGEEEHGTPRLDCREKKQKKTGARNGNRSRRRRRKVKRVGTRRPGCGTKTRKRTSRATPAAPNPTTRRGKSEACRRRGNSSQERKLTTLAPLLRMKNGPGLNASGGNKRPNGFSAGIQNEAARSRQKSTPKRNSQIQNKETRRGTTQIFQ
jgi:hypothetical protein